MQENENKIVAAKLTVAYYSARIREAVDAEAVVHTYETFRKLVQERADREAEESVPEKLKPEIERLRRRRAS
jgi:hypothetical protein